MGKEIERKFLLKNEQWRGLAEGTLYRQGYISTDENRAVRVRVIGEKGFLTIKGRQETLLVRLEYEYEIPLEDANELLDKLCDRPIIEKYRYKIPFGGMVWELDEFLGENAGLFVAEVELSHESQTVELPDWVGDEVTEDPRYLNVNLIQNPYNTWEK